MLSAINSLEFLSFVLIFIAMILTSNLMVSKSKTNRWVGRMGAIAGMMVAVIVLCNIIERETPKTDTILTTHPYSPSGSSKPTTFTTPTSQPATAPSYSALSFVELTNNPNYWSHKLISLTGELKGGCGDKIMYLISEDWKQINWSISDLSTTLQFQEAARDYMARNKKYPHLKISGKVFAKQGEILLIADEVKILD